MGEVFFTTIPYPRLTFGRTLLVFFFLPWLWSSDGHNIRFAFPDAETNRGSPALGNFGACERRSISFPEKTKMVAKGARDQI